MWIVFFYFQFLKNFGLMFHKKLNKNIKNGIYNMEIINIMNRKQNKILSIYIYEINII